MSKRTVRKLSFSPSSSVLCRLCNKGNQYLSTPAQWTNEDAQALASSWNISENDSICKPCRGDITKILHDDTYIPRWKKVDVGLCCIVDCNEKGHSSNILSNNLQQTLIDLQLEHKPITQQIAEIENAATSLCRFHCNISLRHVSSRPCAQPDKVEQLVCYCCYKSHLTMLHSNASISTDSDLEKVIVNLHKTVTEIKNTIKSEDEVLNMALIKTVIDVANSLLKGEALLLPDVHIQFDNHVVNILRDNDMESDIAITSKWILSKLIIYLQHHISFECKVRKHATIIYRQGSDLLLIISKLLWNARSTNPTQEKGPASTSASTSLSDTVAPSYCTPVLEDLNKRIHNTIQNMIALDAESPYDFSQICMSESIKNVDPVLWDAICMLTRSISESRGTSTMSTSSIKYQIKQFRRFFIFATILFCTDDRCNMPLHTFMTDLVESQGGSGLLIKLLNRLGICSSSDVLSRFIQYKADTIKPDEHLDSDSFTIISADNIDFLHSYASIFKGSRNSSWHGTTVQSVQPMPCLSMMNDVTYRMTATSSRKRSRISPLASPLQSPTPKQHRRMRTGTEKRNNTKDNIPATDLITYEKNSVPPSTTTATLNSSITLNDYEIQTTESVSYDDFQELLNFFMLCRFSTRKESTAMTFLNLQDFFSLVSDTHTQKSKYAYEDVIDAVADNKTTIFNLLQTLHEKYIVEKCQEILVVEGDAKIYEILQSLKYEYGDELKWVFPYPGDWHLLKNYQIPLMKAYFDGGLKSLAKLVGYPVASIQACSQFARTHQFILEVWEAMYQAMVSAFITSQTCTVTDMPTLLCHAFDNLSERDDTFSVAFNKMLLQLSDITTATYAEFKKFVALMANDDDIWRYWIQFVFEDALPYVSLFLALRSGDWDLRIASLKQMVPLFTIFDHKTCQKVITLHLTDLLQSTSSKLIGMFKQGAFVVNIKGRPLHSVAIDEAHEMLINKSCKTAIVKPNPDYINRLASYLPYRSKAIDNFTEQLLISSQHNIEINSPFTSVPSDIKHQDNVETILQHLHDFAIFSIESVNRGLQNPFTNQKASPEQRHDLLQFRTMGKAEYLQRISSVILKQPSTAAPNRKHRIQTFTEKKTQNRKTSHVEKDRQLILSAMKKKIQFSKKTGRPIDTLEDQLIEMPLAICSHDGFPLKGQKSNTSKHLENRYQRAVPQVFLSEIPWTPLKIHKTISDYCHFLQQRFIHSHFKKGCTEVHVIFDNPGQLPNTPKFFVMRSIVERK
jgi:hypothetical protein